MEKTLKQAKEASIIIKNAPAAQRSKAIECIGKHIDISRASILEANKIDVSNAEKDGLSSAMIDRLALTDRRLDDIIKSMDEIAAQGDPVGEVLGGDVRPNGMRVVKLRVPLGVVGIIYESRPNVTADCAALCLRSGNTVMLRGGKEAFNSNKILAELIKKALSDAGLPEHAVTLLNDPDRSKMMSMLKAVDSVDLIIPRGGEGLIRFVTENSLVPVIKHDKGVCNIFVDQSADIDMAVNIINNAKIDKPSACNAAECVLIHEEIAERILPIMFDKLTKAGVELRGDKKAASLLGVAEVKDDEWGTEYLDLILAVKIVKNMDEAVEYISKYGSAHSDAIITNDYNNSQEFLAKVDSACVYVNASTRFTDGGVFGMGAEVGISTQKLHSRGPMGAFDLTTTKYTVYGEGQIR